MKKRQDKSTRAFALRITLSVALISTAVILLASSFTPLAGGKTDSESAAADAQEADHQNQLRPQVYKAVGFGVTPAIRDLKQDAKHKDTGVIEGDDEPIRPIKKQVLLKAGDKRINIIDPLLALAKPGPVQPNVLPVPTQSFDGVSSDDNAAAFGVRKVPPDTNGDVGPTQYVQTVNILFRVFTKTGTPLTAPTKMSTVFAAAGITGVCATNDNGDSIALYDSLADRWLISQFAFDSDTTPPFHQCIVISKTGDASGAYFAYDFIVPRDNFPDYPHFGVWPDAYYMTDNQFDGNLFTGTGAFAFDRVKMLAGDSTAAFIYFNQEAPREGGQLPSDVDGLNPPPPGTPNYFCRFTSAMFGDPEGDGLKIFEFHADFATPANSTFTLQQNLPVAAFDPRAHSRSIEQPPPADATMYLDQIQDRLMHRVQYRNFGTRDSLTLNHTVNVSGVNPTTAATHQAGIRYYDLRRATPGTGLFTVGDQGTFSPDAGNGATGINRWMGSAAQDNQGNLAVGYSTSGITVFPSVSYTGRLFGDPPGTLQVPEQILVAGTGVQTRTISGRWGDYSMLGVDPRNDCDFWYTQEYYTAASQATSSVGWVTRIGSFKFPSCTAPQQGTLNVTVTNCGNGQPLPNVSVTINGNSYGVTLADGTFSAVLPPGTYTVTVSKIGFGSASQNGLVVTNGGTATVNQCLTGVPVLVPMTATLVSESCQPANGVIDPGETVTVAFGVQNIGGANTVNDVGTLQATGGVLSPSGPQNYGLVVAGGASVSRNFTFTASPQLACGAKIYATIAHDDSGSLGNVLYTVPTGVVVGFPITISYTGPTVAIPDNVPAGVNIVLPVSGISGTVAKLDFALNSFMDPNCSTAIGDPNASVAHTSNNNLAFKLTSPIGTTVNLILNRGGTGHNFCYVVLDDDDHLDPVWTMPTLGAIEGGFNPESPLSAFNGQDPNGNWTLNVSDNASGDTGSVRGFSLIITAPTCCVPPPPPPPVCQWRVLVIYADSVGAPSQLQSEIQAEPSVVAVDLFNAGTATPTLALLQQYDLVVPMSHSSFADGGVTLGNNLADYVDGGGIVVQLGDSQFGPSAGLSIDGRWTSGNYNPYTYSYDLGSSAFTLGAYNANHPLMAGVTTLNSNTNNIVSPAPGATQVAAASNGNSLVAFRPVSGGHTTVGITAYLGVSATQSGDWGRLIVNARRWLGPSCAPAVLSAVSRKVHGAAGAFDVSLPLVAIDGTVGVECRTGAVAGEHQIVVTFAHPVTVGGVSVTSGTGSGTFSVNGAVVTINLTGVTNAQRLGVTLSSVSDGVNVGDIMVPIGVLLGDATGNGTVNSTDVSLTKLQSGQAVTNANFREDVNANGSLNASDVSSVKLKSGTSLP